MNHNLKNIAFSIMLLSLIAFSISCSSDGDDAPAPLTKAEEVTILLVGDASDPNVGKTWSLATVDVSGIDYTDVYTNFTVDFTDGQFTITNGGPFFPGNGTWTFASDAAETVVLNSGVELTIQELSEQRLIFSVQIDETLYGRTEQVGGNNIFTLNR